MAAEATNQIPSALKKDLQKREELMQYLHANPRALTLDFLIEHNLPIYVKNNTRIGAEIVIDVKDPNTSKTTPIKILNTDIPLELTQSVAPKALDQMHFKRMLHQQTIVLVDPISAQEQLSTPAAQRKLVKLNMSRYAQGSTETISDSFTQKPLNQDTNVVPGAPIQAHQGGEVSDRLRALVVAYQEKTLSPEDFADSVSDNARTFTPRDWGWLVGEVPENTEIQLMCKQQLSVPV